MPPKKSCSYLFLAGFLVLISCAIVVGLGSIAFQSLRSGGDEPGFLASYRSQADNSARPSVLAISPTPDVEFKPDSTPAISEARPTSPPTTEKISTEDVGSTPAPDSPAPTATQAPFVKPASTVTLDTADPRPELSPTSVAPKKAGVPAALPETPATRLVIPGLDLDANVILAPIVDGTWQVSELGTELVGHLEGTARPGSSSNTVLAAHVTTQHNVYGPFAGLGQLQAGDPIIVYVDDQSYTYLVDHKQLVDRSDVHVAFPTDHAQLTMVTCNNWSDELGVYTERLIVVAYPPKDQK